MSNNGSGEKEIAKMVSTPNTDNIDNKEMNGPVKIAELMHTSKVRVMKEGIKDFIDVDVENIDEGQVYGVEYQGDVYGIEKLSDGKIVLYEAVD
jgi:hypothetical protein